MTLLEGVFFTELLILAVLLSCVVAYVRQTAGDEVKVKEEVREVVVDKKILAMMLRWKYVAYACRAEPRKTIAKIHEDSGEFTEAELREKIGMFADVRRAIDGSDRRI